MAITKPVNAGYSYTPLGTVKGSHATNYGAETWIEYKVTQSKGTAKLNVKLYAGSSSGNTSWAEERYFGYLQCNGGTKHYYKTNYQFGDNRANLFAEYEFTVDDDGNGTAVTLYGAWETTTTSPSSDYGPFTNSEYISNGSVSATFTLPVFYQKTIILTFDANGGTGAPAPMSATVYSEGAGYTFTIPNTLPTKTGYTCLGWSLIPNIAEDWYPGDTITVSEDTILYAVYEAVNYLIDINGVLDGVHLGYIDGYGTFDVYINGSLVADKATDYNALHPYGTVFEVTNIKASTGKTYLGVTAGSLSGTLVGNMTTQLNFKTNTYPFNLNILLPSGAEPWDTGAAGTVDVSVDGGASWYEDQKNEPNEGNSLYPYGTVFKFKDFKPGTGLRLSFVSGATQNADGTWSATQGTEDLVVKFHTAYKTYTVTYDANGGSGSMTPSTATYGEGFTTNPNTFKRSGYEFIGWNEAPDGSGVAWDLNSSGVYESGKGPWIWVYDYGITLYAQWKPKAEMFAKDGDRYRRGLAKVKHDSKWREGTTIYKKINGRWTPKK